MLGEVCRQFRIANHFVKYVRYALEHNLYNDLTMRIADSVSKGDVE